MTAVSLITDSVDAAGLEIRQLSTFTRVGATNLTIGLSPAPGSIDYGINGASPRPRARSLWCRPAGLSALCRIAASAPTIEEPPTPTSPIATSP
jgi:hypothetical protein